MKKNQMEVMKEARNRALETGVSFYTMNLKNDSGKKGNGNIMAAYRPVRPEDFPPDSYGHLLSIMSASATLRMGYRVQFSFCSPSEKNPSRIFGEGQAALRFFNPDSALFMKLGSNHSLTEGLRMSAIEIAHQRSVSWMMDKTIEDLV
jgi:hypothetical protein